jgi:hypothetical protein
MITMHIPMMRSKLCGHPKVMPREKGIMSAGSLFRRTAYQIGLS